MNEDDENVLLKVIMEMTPLTNFPSLEDWYVKFKAKMGVIAPDLEFEVSYNKDQHQQKREANIPKIKKKATSKKIKGKTKKSK